MAVFKAVDALESFSIDDVNGNDRALRGKISVLHVQHAFLNNFMSPFAKQQPDISTLYHLNKWEKL